MGKRSGHPELWAGERRRTKTWGDIPKWNREAAAKGVRYRVFSNSLSDFFDNQVPERWRDDAWNYINAAPNLDFLILTKRPQHWPAFLPTIEPGERFAHVRLGVTIENDEARKKRWPHLALAGALGWPTFISYEPALSPVDWSFLAELRDTWLIAGGESGRNARPFRTEYAEDALMACRHHEVPFFLKQFGANVIQDGEHRLKRDPKGGDWSEWPHHLRVREFPPSLLPLREKDAAPRGCSRMASNV